MTKEKRTLNEVIKTTTGIIKVYYYPISEKYRTVKL